MAQDAQVSVIVSSIFQPAALVRKADVTEAEVIMDGVWRLELRLMETSPVGLDVFQERESVLSALTL